MDERKKAILRDPLRALVTARVRGGGLVALLAAAFGAMFLAVLALRAGTQGALVTALISALCLDILLWGAKAALGEESEAGVWLCVALLGALAIWAHLALLDIKPGRWGKLMGPLLDEMWNYDLLTATAWEENGWSGVYLLVCGLVSRLESFPRMTAIKLFDLVCQCVCAAAVVRLALARGAKATGAIAGMMACVLAPTMLFNAGVWLHCDATFAMLTLWGLVLILKDRPLAGCALWGLALGTKLQSAFLFPLLIPMFMKGKVSLRHMLALLAAALVCQAAILLDRQGLSALVMRYSLQLEEARTSIGLGDHAPGVFGLMKVASVREFSGMGLYFGIACALLVAMALLRAKDRPSDEVWLLGAWLLAAGLPLVLPQMSARSLYLAGMLAFALAGNARRMIACALLEFTSLCGYMASIFGAEILPISALSLMGIAAALLILLETTSAIRLEKGEAHGQAA